MKISGRFLVAFAAAFAASAFTAPHALAANTALLIGNENYEPKCEVDVPSVPGDIAAAASALANSGYGTPIVGDRSGIEMTTDVESNIPPTPDKYVIYYIGHAETAVSGSPRGIDCTRMTPADLIGALGDAADGALLIVDACASGTYTAAVNALDERICTISSTTGDDCRPAGGFTPCFVAGLNGAADANTNGTITVQEAAIYAIANCGDAGTLPTWDGGCPDLPIGMGVVAVDAASWGRVKAGYR